MPLVPRTRCRKLRQMAPLSPAVQCTTLFSPPTSVCAGGAMSETVPGVPRASARLVLQIAHAPVEPEEGLGDDVLELEVGRRGGSRPEN